MAGWWLNCSGEIIFQYLHNIIKINKPASLDLHHLSRNKINCWGSSPTCLQSSGIFCEGICAVLLGWARPLLTEIQNFLCPEKILPFESQTNKGVIRQNNFKISQRMKESFQIFQYQRLRKWSLSLSVSPLDIKFIWKQSLSSSEFSNRTKSNWY